MDLSLSEHEQRFAGEVRDWLRRHRHEVPDTPEAGASFGDGADPTGAPLSSAERLAAEVEAGRAWQRSLASGGWVGIDWPSEYGGRGASALEVAIFNSEYARSGAPQLVNRVGINLAGPTLMAHGTREQCRRWLPGITTAEEIWCQLFSEPGAGSDLSSLATRALPHEDGWCVTGQKVWTSYAQFARWGLCLARSTEGSTGARGLSLFVVDMSDPGVETRPLVQMTGDAEFNEVFLDEVVVPRENLVGPEGQGWTVASTTLAHERGTNFPFKEEVVHEGHLSRLYEKAVSGGSIDDPAVSDALVDAYVRLSILRTHNWRTLSRLARGIAPGPESSWVKLTWSEMTQSLSDTALLVLGTDSPGWGPWQRQWLWSKAASIAGGTSEIQRNVIAERILGLPREPRGPDKAQEKG